MIRTNLHGSGITAVRPGVDRLTAANAKTFKETVGQLIESGESRLVIDFSQVTFVDSSGLGALVGLLKKIGYRGDLSVCGLNAEVAQMFRICRMDSVFKISATVEQAVDTMTEAL